MSGKPESGVHFSRFAFLPTVIMSWGGNGAALARTMTIADGIGASPRSTVVCAVATSSCLRYMLIVVLEVKNVPTNHLLVPSSLRIESKKQHLDGRESLDRICGESTVISSSATKESKRTHHRR